MVIPALSLVMGSFPFISRATSSDKATALSDDTSSMKEVIADPRTQIPYSLHDNGPPGFVRRRQLDESVTNPTFIPTQVDKPKEVPTEKEKEKFVTAGSFPHSILIPGTRTSIRLSGFIRFDALYDLDPIGDDRQMDTSSIPVPQEKGRSTNFDFSWSRLTLETHTANDMVDDVRTFLQTDFFGSNNSLRVRWAYVDFGLVRAGQAASVFMDYDMWPNVIDPDGPNAMLLKRHPILQLTVPLNRPLTDRFKLAVGLEDPSGSLTVPGSGKTLNKLPDFTSHLRYDNPNGHFQVSGLLRQLTFQRSNESETHALAYGTHFSADLHPWALAKGTRAANSNPTPLEKSRLMGQIAFGKGFTSYLESAQSGLDGTLNASGDLKALPITTWTLAYEHWWVTHWTSTVSYGSFNISPKGTIPGDSQSGSQFFAGNLMWVPTKQFWVGVEYLWGKRRDFNDDSATAKRWMLGIQYKY